MERELVETEGCNYSIVEYQSSSGSGGGGGGGDRDQKNTNTTQWTDEKHLHFLRFLEDAFVKSMFQTKNIRGDASWCRRDRKDQLRLDRYVPDSSESTLDVKRDISKRKKNISSSSTDEADSSSTTDKSDPRRSSTRRQRRRLAATADRYSIIPRDPVVPAVGVGKR